MALGIEQKNRVVADTGNQLMKLRFAESQSVSERLLGTRVIHAAPRAIIFTYFYFPH
jgi:hypothetical protein